MTQHPRARRFASRGADYSGTLLGAQALLGRKCDKGSIEIPPLGDAAVSPPGLFCLSKERSKGEGVERHKERLQQEHG